MEPGFGRPPLDRMGSGESARADTAGIPQGRARATFGAVYCVYDDLAWLPDSVESVYSSCDAIYFLVSDRPWNGSPSDTMPTIELIEGLDDPEGKMRLVLGRWSNEAEQRNAGMDLLKEAGIDYCFVVDGDEVYDPDVLARMMATAASMPAVDCWHMTWFTYWKSVGYRIDPPESFRPLVFAKVGSARFTENRAARGEQTRLIPPHVGVCHHLSYVRTDEQILRKITTFSHASEVQPGWFERVWKGWDADASMTDLHPTHPAAYHMAVDQPRSALPPVLRRHCPEGPDATDGARQGSGQDPLVSIVICCLNNKEDTRACLASVEAHTPPPHEIILVDNGSTDSTVDLLRSYAASHSHVRVIANNANLGFAAGNNQGMALARGKNVLLLNNDTLVTEGWLEQLLDVLDRYPEVGIVGPVSNRVSGPQLVPEAAYRTRDEMEAFAAGWTSAHAGESAPIGRVVGFCLMARRAVIERIGGLDERFGSGNFEDDDFCVRAAFASFGARVARAAFVHHAGSRTFTSQRIDWQQAMLRNWELFKTKWSIAPESPIEEGYRIWHQPGDPAQLYVPLPDLTKDHRCDREQRWWQPATVADSRPPVTASPITTLIIDNGQGLDLLWNSLVNHSRHALDITVVTTDGGTRAVRPIPEQWSLEFSPRGIVPALNRAMQQPAENPILLVSSDVIVTPDWLDRLLAALERDPGIAAIAPMSGRAPAPQRLTPTYHGTGKEMRRFAHRQALRHRDGVLDAPYIGSFCAVMRRSLCRQLGAMLEELEPDLAFWEFLGRIRQSGSRLAVATGAYVHHELLDCAEGAGYDDLAEAEATVDRAMAAGEAAVRRGELGVAEAEFLGVTKSFPDLASGHLALGSVRLALGRAGEAVASLGRAAQLAPRSSALHAQLGIAYFQTGEMESAESALRRARELDRDNPRILLNLTELYRVQGRYVEATQAIKEAMRLDANHPDVLTSFGVISLELGDIEGAEMAVRRIQAVAPNHPGMSELQEALSAARAEPAPDSLTLAAPIV